MLKDLKNKASAMVNLMENLSEQLDQITPSNFDEKFQFALETMMVIQKIKEDLIKKYGIEALEKNEPRIIDKAKQIEKKYDNIIEQFKLEVSKLEKELSSLNSQRKIINYLR